MNGAGKISWTEFLGATIESKGRIGEDEFSEAFEHLDFDKNGYISTSVRFSYLLLSFIFEVCLSLYCEHYMFKDLRKIIGRDLPQSILDQIIDESDITRDHKIWKEEFLALAEESHAVDFLNNQRKSLRVYLKRCSSADDFDLMKTRSVESVSSSDRSDREDRFLVEKGKSVRKVTQFA